MCVLAVQSGVVADEIERLNRDGIRNVWDADAEKFIPLVKLHQTIAPADLVALPDLNNHGLMSIHAACGFCEQVNTFEDM